MVFRFFNPGVRRFGCRKSARGFSGGRASLGSGGEGFHEVREARGRRC